MKRPPIRRKRWRTSLGTPEQRLVFRLGVLTQDGFDCVMHGQSDCTFDLQAAHIIPKRTLRDLGFGADVIYSVDAAMTLCERHHNRHDRGLERVPWDRLPDRCKEFVSRLGLQTLLERTYEEVRP